VFALSTLVDRVYYQQWALPPLRFLYFNIAQSLAVFYGRNPWHYYLTQGYPLLLTTFLPFGLVGLYQSLSSASDTDLSPLSRRITHQLATTAVVVPAILSLISHKEVRFIYPLLPLLHVLSAPSFVSFFHPCITPASPRQYHALLPRRLLLVCLALATLALSLLTTTSHQTAPLSVMNYLRSQYTSHYLTQPPSASALTPAPSIMTVGFLMPCHSTPWRSHLVFSGIKAWALGCEPPVGLNATEREHYLDEADRFYTDPNHFLNHELGKAPQAKRSGFLGFGRQEGGSFPSDQVQQPGEIEPWDGRLGRKQWPEYVAFFGQLEPTMQTVLKGSQYRECWRGWNSWGHDDWRRKGDIVVWCARDREKKREKREKEKLRKGWW
jgi:phosphatidylinositol glycan class B